MTKTLTEWIKNFFKTKQDTSQCVIWHVVPKDELIDYKDYRCYVYDKLAHRKVTCVARWSAERNLFIEDSFHSYTYEEAHPTNFRDSYEVLNYNPNKINALDLKPLSDICFQLSDENTQSDEIWDKLITYFEERGIK